ncbi:MAG TPA: radical SAM protein [Terriglobales bacterium]|nr:radical SAM protein [Terriglobales bacterium]
MQTSSATFSAASVSELSFLWLELTTKCNLQCIHCYADSGPHQQLLGNMSTDDWLTVLRDSHEAGCRQVQFIGGEPTLHPDLPGMISFAAEQGYSFIEVYTNATRISDQLLKVFVDHEVRIAISFYSDDLETHDRITKNRGSFNRTVQNIRRMLSAGLQIRAGIIALAENADHIERAERFLRELGVTDIKVDFKRGVGRGAGPLTSLDPMAELCGECWKGKLCVTNTGQTYPCVFSRFAKIGDAKQGVSQILATDSLWNFRRSLQTKWRNQESPVSVEAGCDPCNPPPFPAEPPAPQCQPSAYSQRGTLSSCDPCNPPPFDKCRP